MEAKEDDEGNKGLERRLENYDVRLKVINRVSSTVLSSKR